MADFDDARFVEEVLKPVQDGWRPTDNLFRVYVLPVGVSDQNAIQAALDVVQRQLGSQRLERMFPAAITRLRSGHPDAVKILTDPRQRQQHAADVGRLAEQLQESLRDRVAGGPGLPTALVAAIVADSRGAHTRNEVREALSELSASAQDPVDLPSPAQPKAWPQISGALGPLGKSSLFDYLATTSELASATTTANHLDARAKVLRLRRDSVTTAESNLIENLRGIIRANGLIDVLRFEVLAELQREAAYRFPVLLDKTKSMGARLKAIGIGSPARAVAYAVWCRERYPEVMGASRTGWKLEKREALAGKDLRRAIEALQSADKRSTEEDKELKELTTRVRELNDEIARARGLEEQRPEEAAEIYLSVRAQLSDPAVEAGLVRCRPGPPRGVTARLDGAHAVVAWQPSPATAGRLGYTVVRAVGHGPIGVADGRTVVTDAAGLSVVDTDPPTAQELYYAVFALREGVSLSEAAALTTPLVVLPEVADLELIPSADTIRARWQVPAGAAGVEVARRTAGRDGTWHPVRDVRRQDFTDTDVTSGVAYEYRVQARYLLSGSRSVLSAGRTVSGRCQEVPVAVTQLDATLDGDDVVISWPVPPRGEVEIRQLHSGRLTEGSVVPVTTLDGVAPPLGDIVLRRRSELRARPRPGTGSLTLLAVTVLGELAAIGPTRVLDRRIRPVSDLRATRQGHSVQLTWVWPDEVIEARVLHRVGAEPTGPDDEAAQWHMISRVSYDAVGAHFALDPGENVFAVSTTSVNTKGRNFGPLVKVTVISVAEITYRIARAGMFGKRRVLTVGAAAGPALPRLQLVARSRVRPMERTQGPVLLDLAGGVPELTQEFEIPRDLGRPIHLRLFALEPGIVLRAEHAEELIVS
jgi:hypothetical protein